MSYTYNASIVVPHISAESRARQERELAEYRARLENIRIPAQPVDIDYLGIPAKQIPGGSFVAVASNGRRNSAEWAILKNGDAAHVDNVLCYLRKKEVTRWLIKAEPETIY
jgi:hypothetical protein